MGWNRSATIVSVVVFLAFGFMVIGVFSDPISHNVLPIASRSDNHYGILGYCRSSSSDYKCSGYGLGYDLNKSDSWPSSSNTLTKVFIVHIIAAGLLLISLFLTALSHMRRAALWIVTGVFLIISCLAAALAFAVELYVFKTNLHFAGWFGLPAAVLSLIGAIFIFIMHHQLQARLGSTSVHAEQDFITDTVPFNDFGITSNEEKPLKPNSNVTSYPLKNSSGASFNPLNPASHNSPFNRSRNSLSSRGYQKIPENRDGPPVQSKQEKDHPLPLPHSQSNGAIPRLPTNTASASVSSAASVDKYPTGGNSVSGTQNGNHVYGNSEARSGFAAPVKSQGYTSRDKAPQAYVSNTRNPPTARAPGLGSNGSNMGTTQMRADINDTVNQPESSANIPGSVSIGTTERLNSPRTQRQETWSQVALNKANVHASTASIASSQAVNVPAGRFINGVDSSGGYGPNVVQIPQIRNGTRSGIGITKNTHGDPNKGSSKTLTKSPPSSQGDVPNFSRTGDQEKRVGQMETRQVPNLTSLPAPQRVGNGHIAKMSLDSEMSNYSETRTRTSPVKGGTQGPCAAQANQSQARLPTTSQAQTNNHQAQTATYQYGYYDYEGAYDPNYPNSQVAQQQDGYKQYGYDQNAYYHQPNYYNGQDQIAYNQAVYDQSCYPNYAQGSTPGYTSQEYDQQYDQQYGHPQYGIQQFGGQQYGYGHQNGHVHQNGYSDINQYSSRAAPNNVPTPTQRKQPSKPQGSDIALLSNPDFSLGDIGKRRRPGRR